MRFFLPGRAGARPQPAPHGASHRTLCKRGVRKTSFFFAPPRCLPGIGGPRQAGGPRCVVAVFAHVGGAVAVVLLEVVSGWGECSGNQPTNVIDSHSAISLLNCSHQVASLLSVVSSVSNLVRISSSISACCAASLSSRCSTSGPSRPYSATPSAAAVARHRLGRFCERACHR